MITSEELLIVNHNCVYTSSYLPHVSVFLGIHHQAVQKVHKQISFKQPVRIIFLQVASNSLKIQLALLTHPRKSTVTQHMNQFFQITRENIKVYVQDTHYQGTAVSDNGTLTKIL
jgi:hypothetical protein